MMKGGKTVSAGDPSHVLTAENIASVYGVEAVVRKQSEAPYIIPVGPIKTKRRQ
jgi:iron complex transport system ATP-binding protein